jgi:hypothetical protein
MDTCCVQVFVVADGEAWCHLLYFSRQSRIQKRIFGRANPLHRNKAGGSPAGRSRFLRGSPGVLFHIYTDACVNKKYHGSNELGDVQQTSNEI